MMKFFDKALKTHHLVPHDQKLEFSILRGISLSSAILLFIITTSQYVMQKTFEVQTYSIDNTIYISIGTIASLLLMVTWYLPNTKYYNISSHFFYFVASITIFSYYFQEPTNQTFSNIVPYFSLLLLVLSIYSSLKLVVLYFFLILLNIILLYLIPKHNIDLRILLECIYFNTFMFFVIFGGTVLKNKNEEIKKNLLLRNFQSSKTKSIGELAQNISHELINPLSISIGNTQLILKKIEGEPTNKEQIKQLLIKTMGGLDRINKTISIFSKLAQSRKESISEFNLAALISAIQSLIANNLTHRNISFLIDDIPNIKIRGNQNDLSHAMIYLINNSIEALSEFENKIIRISFIEENQFVELRISDNGSGVSPAIKEHIMEPFFSTKPSNTNTGLGLAISHHLMLSNGGDLFLDPESELVTTFVLKIKKSN